MLYRCKWCECQIRFHPIGWFWEHAGTGRTWCNPWSGKKAAPEDE